MGSEMCIRDSLNITSLEIECPDGIFNVGGSDAAGETKQNGAGDAMSEVEDASMSAVDSSDEEGDTMNGNKDAVNNAGNTTSEVDETSMSDVDSEDWDNTNAVEDAASEDEDAMRQEGDATNGGGDAIMSDVDSSDEDDDRSFSDSSEAPGGQVDRLLLLLGLGQEYHNRVYQELSNNRHNFNKTLEKLSGVPMFIRSLIGSNDITPYGGRLTSVVNALRQHGFSVLKVLFGVFQIDDTDIIGYIYGDDNAVYGVERRSISETQLYQKTRGYDVYIVRVRNPYT